jgi:hypothetical protein
MPAGRPTKYDPDYHPEHAYKLALLSHTGEEIAAFFEIDVVTFYRWQVRHDEFRKAVMLGKVPADADVVLSCCRFTSAPAATISRPRRFSATRARSSGLDHHAHPARSGCCAELAQEPPARQVTRQEAVGGRGPGRTGCGLPSGAGLQPESRRNPMQLDACDGIGFQSSPT